MECELAIAKNIQPIIQYSGRGFFHRGHYYDCLEQPTMKFALVEVASKGVDTGASIALCLPRACTDQFVKNSINKAMDQIGLPLSALSIESNMENYNFPMNWVSYLTTLILITLALLALLATVRGFKHKNSNKWLECFNISSNIDYFKVRPNEDLNAWDGVRSFSMMWVVFGHSFQMFLASCLNIANYSYIASSPFVLLLLAGILSVDIFLFLGGFFLAFVMLRHMITLKVCGMGILQRALRVWPAYVLSMMFYYSLVPRLGSGPYWNKYQINTDLCQTMWHQVLFIGNLVNNGSGECLDWGWYLQVDFQLFILSVFLLYLYSRKRLAYYITCGTLIIASTVLNYIVATNQHVRIITDLQAIIDFQKFTLDLYIKPYGRCVPYLMGLILGNLYMEYRQQQRKREEVTSTLLSKVKAAIFQRTHLRRIVEWTGIALMILVLVLPLPLQHGYKWSQAAHSLYYCLSKPVFLFGMTLTLLPSILGFPSVFNTILNARALTFVARISFCTYLVHLIILYGYVISRSYDIYYHLTDVFVEYHGILVLSLFFGFIMTITIQLPFANLLKQATQSLKTQGNMVKQSAKGQSLLSNQAKGDKTSLLCSEDSSSNTK